MNRKALLVALAFLVLVILLIAYIAAFVFNGAVRHARQTARPESQEQPAESAPRLPAPTDSPSSGHSIDGPLEASRPKPQTFRPTSSKAKLQVLEYEHFTVGYDNERRNPAWVVYDLDGPPAFPGHEAKRPGKFKTDERTSARVTHSDYSNSGFDRGHMCPSAAEFSRFGEAGEDATFIMTNVIPQVHSLNAGVWEDLEAMVAGRGGDGGWAQRLGHLTIINGPVYGIESFFPPTAPKVAIPGACYSIVLDYVEASGTYRALAFEMPDKDGTTGPLTKYLVSIRKIEDDTGLDVFAGVDPAVRAEVETTTTATALW